MTAVLIKSLAVLIIAASLAVAIGAKKSEYAFLLSLACSAVVLIMIFGAVSPYIDRLKTVFYKVSSGAEYFVVPLKALGIAYLTDFVADSCRDTGQSALAAKAELAGKCAIFALCVPSAISVLEVALKFAGL